MINVIIPTYNEAQNITVLLRMLEYTLSGMKVPYLIIVTDDSSPDGTAEIVRKLNLPNVKLIIRPGKLGLGSAYSEGLKHCKYPYTILMDADLQHDPFTIPLMFELATSDKKYDIVTGTRYAKTGMVCNWSFKRKFISLGANTLARFVLGLSTTDLTGSFRCYKTNVLREIIKQTKCKGFGFQMEIIARAEMLGKKIAEVPIVFYDRATGESKLGTSEIVKFIQSIAALYLNA